MICTLCGRWSARGRAVSTANGVPQMPLAVAESRIEIGLEAGDGLGVPVAVLLRARLVGDVREGILRCRGDGQREAGQSDKRAGTSHSVTSGGVNRPSRES